MSKIQAAITGIQGYVPEDVITNKDLEKLVDTNDEWIVSRTGIKRRHILKNKNQGTSVMILKAVEGLLEKTYTKAKDIDMVICATTTPDYVFPATANIISSKIGAINAFGYDLQAACSGFLFGLATGSQFIQTGKYKKILIIGADKMSSIVDYTDRSTSIIFGDGAGAVLLEPTEEDYGIKDFILKSDGYGEPYLHMKAGGSKRPASLETIKNREHFVFQKGSIVFKFAVKNMADVAAKIMERNNLKPNDIAYLVPHQANKRIIDATASRMGISDDKVIVNIEEYGNTTNATIPLGLFDYESKFKKGDNLILTAFGGGFTWGSMWLKWIYDSK